MPRSRVDAADRLALGPHACRPDARERAWGGLTALILLLTGLASAPGCGEPSATAADCSCPTADAAAVDVLAELDTPDDSALETADGAEADVGADGVEDGGAAPTCALPWLVVTGDHPVLVPPPLEVTLSAASEGVDLTASCAWAVGPSTVCVQGSAPGRVRKTGDGTCVAVCELPQGVCGGLELAAEAQTVLYVVGGESTAFPPPPGAHADAARIQRLRVADGIWDEQVAWLPEYRIQPALATTASHLYVLGGETGGDWSAVEFWDVFFPQCPEAIITPTQLKAEVGCRAVRRLDLATGQWDAPMQWLHPRLDMGVRQIGAKVWLFGGLRAKTVTEPAEPEVLFVADLASGDVQAGAAVAPPSFAVASPKIAWPRIQSARLGGQPLLFHAGGTWLVAPDGSTVTSHDLGWPCPEASPQAVVRLPGLQDDILVLPSPDAQGEGCPACPDLVAGEDGMPTEWCTPWRYHAGKWSQGAPMPYGQVVEGPDGAYVLATGGTWRLQSGDGTWQKVAPAMPYPRFGFAAAAVSQ